MNIEYLKNKRVLIFGLGINDGGAGMAQFFATHAAHVTIVDGKDEQFLAPSLEKLREFKNISYELAIDSSQSFKTHDIIVRNPAIKPDNEYLQIARGYSKEIIMEMEYFIRHSPGYHIGITGTKGKSTTTSLSHHIYSVMHPDALLAGNIGRSAIRELDSITPDQRVFLELSSFQLDGMRENHVSPDIGLITNIYEDHLNWHTDMADYIDSKLAICRYQSVAKSTLLNIDNEILANAYKQAPDKFATYSLLDSSADYYLDSETGKVYAGGQLLFEMPTHSLLGRHNLYNILAASVLNHKLGVSVEQIVEGISSYKPLEGRQELIREVGGVKYINNTTATSVEAVNAFIEGYGPLYKGKIVMIAGGVDKGLDYKLLADGLNANLKALVLLEGTASEKIDQVVTDVEKHKFYGDFAEAIRKASELAQSGDVVVLCPGAASFNMFKNEFDRGEQFNLVVKSL